jgi:para-nitrobenzyl esterase
MSIKNPPSQRSAAVWLALSAALALSACGSGDDAPTAPAVAVTAKGSVQGVDRLGMRSYFAIPYARPPVGALRWQAPQAPDSWAATRARTASATPCLQTSASPFRLTGDSEDCLYLDVHAPTGEGPFPVMVWIHGGAFNTGGTASYEDPSPLVSKGVIVVNIAYRLGAMGFLGHPALADAGGSAGNYGVMDQQAALRWVQDNIGVFAGDKDNVTIFGESAGGMSVMTHLASPLSARLFNKAIVQSGAYGVNGQLPLATLQANSTTVVNNALAAAGITCATVDAACLRALPDAVVRNQLATAFNASMGSPTPSIDGKVLPKSIKATFAAGENHKVPVINGSNEDEYALFIAISELARRNAAVPPNADPANTSFALAAAAYPATAGGLAAGTGVTAAALASTLYPLANYGSNAALQPSLAASALGTDVVFACNGLNVSKRVQAQNTPVWMYEFRDQTAPPSAGAINGSYALSFPQGAGHSYEIQYLFNLRDLQNGERRALQGTMSQYWTNFAREGNPNTGGAVPAWAGFGTGAVQGLDVASGGGVAARTAAGFAAQHQCDTTWTALTF